MTSSNKPQTEADNVWPPAVAHLPGFLPTVASDAKQRDLRRGRSALLSAVLGIGLAALATGIGLAALQTGWVRSVPWAESNCLLLTLLAIYLIGLICEVVAVVAGSISRRTRTGRWSLAISVIALTAFFLYAPHMIHRGEQTGVWPWSLQYDDVG